MRQAIDEAAAIARTPRDFAAILYTKGYTVRMDENRKYFTICSIGSKKPVRMARLGEGYDNRSIMDRICRDSSPARFQGNREFWQQQQAMRNTRPRQVRLSGSLRRVKKATGLRALYLHYCYLLGFLPKDRTRCPLSPEMREAVRRMDRYSAQAWLVVKYGLDSLPAVEGFLVRTDQKIAQITGQRDKLYNQMRRCADPARMRELKAQRDICTGQLKALRFERKTARSVIESQKEIKENLRAETALKRELYRPEADKGMNRKRGYER